MNTSKGISNIINKHCIPIHHRQNASKLPETYKQLFDAIGDAEIVMIGEASHGTHDFYYQRAEITKHLIEHMGFTFVAIEADWPDAYRLNRYVQHGKNCRDTSAKEALGDFRRFPMWMWRNYVVEGFGEWLREHNAERKEKVAFYGMDLYSMFNSMDQVIEYLEKVSPQDAELARNRYSNFDRFQGEAQAYGKAVGFGLTPDFEKDVVGTLVDLLKRGEDYLRGAGGLIDGDELFYAQQNARVVQNAEEYYRIMYHEDEISWNYRDKHFAETISSLFQFHKQKFPNRTEKCVIWAHNSHLGDARANDRSKRGKWNVGQLLREQFGLAKTFNVGFLGYNGSVTAAPRWDKPGHCYRVRNGLWDSHEHLLHSAAVENRIKDYYLILRSNTSLVTPARELVSVFKEPRLERYIGVIYRPDTERSSHYSNSRLADEWDSVIYLDQTHALEPVDKTEPWMKMHKEIQTTPDPDSFPELYVTLPNPEKWVAYRKEVAASLNHLAADYMRSKQWELAEQKLNKAMHYIHTGSHKYPVEYELQQVRQTVLTNRADCLFQMRKWDEVIRDCEGLLELSPLDPQLNLILGEAYRMKGKVELSQKHFDLAAKITARTPVEVYDNRR